MAEFKLPDVGEGLTEAEIVSWKVKDGDIVEINDIIVEIETAKSLVELPSPYAGTVLALLVAEGERSPSARRSSRSATRRGAAPARPPRPRAAGAPSTMEIDLSNPAASGGGEGESLVGRNKADRGPLRRARKGSASPAHRRRRQRPDAAAGRLRARRRAVRARSRRSTSRRCRRPTCASRSRPRSAIVPPATAPGARALAKPPVRKLAKDLGVDLATPAPHRARTAP